MESSPRGDGDRARQSLWKRLLGAVIAGAAAVFLTLYVRRNWHSMTAHQWTLDPGLGVASVIVLILAFVWGTYLWRFVALRMGADPPGLVSLTRIWFVSSLARYIPGKIWQIVGAAGLVDRRRMSPAQTAGSLLVLMGFALLSGALVALFFAPVERVGPAWFGWLLPGIAVVGAAATMHPRPLSALLERARRWTGRDELRWDGSWRDGLLLVAGSCGAWLAQGVAFWLFARSLTDVSLSALPTLIGVNALAFVGGYLTVVVPAGLGVREALLTVLLAGVFAPGPAAVVAVGSRLWTVVTELLGAGVYEGAWRLGAGR